MSYQTQSWEILGFVANNVLKKIEQQDVLRHLKAEKIKMLSSELSLSKTLQQSTKKVISGVQ